MEICETLLIQKLRAFFRGSQENSVSQIRELASVIVVGHPAFPWNVKFNKVVLRNHRPSRVVEDSLLPLVKLSTTLEVDEREHNEAEQQYGPDNWRRKRNWIGLDHSLGESWKPGDHLWSPPRAAGPRKDVMSRD